ncbi:hypothetical protein Scep_020263 [Stephania cephalantha]|uniref:Subtilisin-like protease SBT1.9 n=1 Tax=Stephania cephalantha TaxID=152367 RepID=A0AAP0ICB8_9MAGN
MAALIAFYLLLFLILISNLTFMSAHSDTYIIHMDASVMPKAFSSHHSWYASVVSTASGGSQSGSTPSLILYTYSNAFHGFSARLLPDKLRAIQNLPGFVSFTRDVPVAVDTTRTPEFLGLNSASGAWPDSNYGKDMIIGLVDTGIWPESDSFKDDSMAEVPQRWKGECEVGTDFNSSMCNKKLIGARFFNKGIISNVPNVSISMNSTRDTDGHGTHTSSTAAGNYVGGASYFGYGTGTARGMAPLAHVAMYKAIWDAGAYASDILAAVDQAIEDGVDVLSLSLGLDGVALHEDPIAIASFAALEKGIFVASSAGNEGPWYGSLHNGIPWTLTVGAGTVDREFNGVLTLDKGISVTGTSLYPKNSLSQVPLVLMNTCNSSRELRKVGYKIVVCIDTDESVGIQVSLARKARVAAGLFITNSTFLDLYIQTSFPAIFLTLQDGQSILEHIKNNPDSRATLEFQKTSLGLKPAPLVAEYSSRGPSPSCPIVLKPDIIAPGSLILASWPRATSVADLESHHLFSDFNVISGTSMSCPHAAGLAALLKSTHPEWSPAAIRSALMTTADNLDNSGNSIREVGDVYQIASPLAMGAGHVNPNKALDPGLIYDANPQDYVNLLCFMNYTMKQIQTITRSASYNCSNPSFDLNYPSFIAFFNGNDSSSDVKTVREFQRTVTNVGDDVSTYKPMLTPMDGFRMTVEPSRLIFKKKDEKLSYKLSIEGPSLMKELVVHGSLAWIDEEGRHVVRSPIVATQLSSDPLFATKV